MSFESQINKVIDRRIDDILNLFHSSGENTTQMEMLLNCCTLVLSKLNSIDAELKGVKSLQNQQLSNTDERDDGSILDDLDNAQWEVHEYAEGLESPPPLSVDYWLTRIIARVVKALPGPGKDISVDDYQKIIYDSWKKLSAIESGNLPELAPQPADIQILNDVDRMKDCCSQVLSMLNGISHDVQLILGDTATLKSDVSSILNKVNITSSDVTSVKNMVSNIQTSINSMINKVDLINTKVDGVKEDTNDIKDITHTISQSVNDLTTDVSGLSDDISSISQDQKNILSTIRRFSTPGE